LGTRHTYTLISGAIAFDTDPVLWSYGLGWGLHFPFSIFALDADISCHSIYSGGQEWEEKNWEKTLLPRVRGLLNVHIFKNVTLFGGFAWNVYVPGLYDNFNPDDCWELDIPFSDEHIYIKQEITGGVSFHLF
jgi:hypothetical protein